MNKNAGFTLIELLVVVLIIGILSAVALPQYQRAVKRAQLIQLISRVQHIAKAGDMYYLANGVYTSDITELGIDAGGKVVEYKQGSFTGDTSNVSAYYDDGSNCGIGNPDGQARAACVNQDFYLVGSYHTLHCAGYNTVSAAVCRSLAGGADPIGVCCGGNPVYLIKW